MRFLAALMLAASAAAQPDPLAVVADRLGGRERFDALQTLRVEWRAEVPQAGRPVFVRTIQSVWRPTAARWEVRTGGTVRTVTVRPEGVFAEVDGRLIALPDSAAREVRAMLWLDPVILLSRWRDVQAEALTDALIRVDIPELLEPVYVGLDAAGKPVRLTTVVHRGGRDDYIAVRVSEYREVDGLLLPFQATQTTAGVKTGTSTRERIEVNPPIPVPALEGVGG